MFIARTCLCKMQFIDIWLKENIGIPHVNRKRHACALNIVKLYGMTSCMESQVCCN